MTGQDSDLIIEIPSKTFIVGEYLALGGTASLLMATEPSFVVRLTRDQRYGFHQDSPAGRLRKKLGLQSWGYSFYDPHRGLGGFGRSTAEYLAVYLHDLVANQGIHDFSASVLENLEDFIHQYRLCCGKEYVPSGADLVAQVIGGLCWYDGMNFAAEKLIWPFPGYDIFVFHTGQKLATHDHLKDLKKKNFKALIPLLIAARSALEQKNLRVFAEAVNAYGDQLNDLGLSDSRVRQSVMNLRKNPEVLAAKGCGAMGVDTVLILGEKSEVNQIKKLAMAEDFTYISCLSDAHHGTRMRSAT